MARQLLLAGANWRLVDGECATALFLCLSLRSNGADSIVFSAVRLSTNAVAALPSIAFLPPSAAFCCLTQPLTVLRSQLAAAPRSSWPRCTAGWRSKRYWESPGCGQPTFTGRTGRLMR